MIRQYFSKATTENIVSSVFEFSLPKLENNIDSNTTLKERLTYEIKLLDQYTTRESNVRNPATQLSPEKKKRYQTKHKTTPHPQSSQLKKAKIHFNQKTGGPNQNKAS